jgi:hypothetical protein
MMHDDRTGPLNPQRRPASGAAKAVNIAVQRNAKVVIRACDFCARLAEKIESRPIPKVDVGGYQICGVLWGLSFFGQVLQNEKVPLLRLCWTIARRRATYAAEISPGSRAGRPFVCRRRRRAGVRLYCILHLMFGAAIFSLAVSVAF